MLRGDELVGCGSSYGGDSQQSSRGWENQGPVWRSCYEYAVVTSRLKRVEATKGDSDQDDDIEALWRKRAELAKGIVDAAAPTIQDAPVESGYDSISVVGRRGGGRFDPAVHGGVRSRARSRRRRGAMPEGSGAGALGIVPAGPGANGRARGAMGLCRAERGSGKIRRPLRRLLTRKGRGPSCTSLSGASRAMKP